MPRHWVQIAALALLVLLVLLIRRLPEVARLHTSRIRVEPAASGAEQPLRTDTQHAGATFALRPSDNKSVYTTSPGAGILQSRRRADTSGTLTAQELQLLFSNEKDTAARTLLAQKFATASGTDAVSVAIALIRNEGSPEVQIALYEALTRRSLSDKEQWELFGSLRGTHDSYDDTVDRMRLQAAVANAPCRAAVEFLMGAYREPDLDPLERINVAKSLLVIFSHKESLVPRNVVDAISKNLYIDAVASAEDYQLRIAAIRALFILKRDNLDILRTLLDDERDVRVRQVLLDGLRT